MSIFFLDCRQTKLFKTIEVRGTLFNYFTKKPMSGAIVKLKSNDVHSASSYSEGSIVLASATTNSDGSFVLKSKASKKERSYVLLEGERNLKGITNSDTAFTSPADKIVYVGKLYSGEYTFSYKVRFKSTTGSCAWIKNNNQEEIKINAGTDTIIFTNATTTYQSIRGGASNGGYQFKIGVCNNPSEAKYDYVILPYTSMDTVYIDKDF
jgi:hypothetical protein